MYIVQCPKCRQRMKVKNELHKVKVRCAHCKEVFLAETEEMSDSPASAGGKSALTGSRPAAPSSAFVPAPEPKAEEPGGIDLDSFASTAPATPGQAAPKVGPRVAKKKSIAPMIVVIAGGVLCIVIAAIVIWQATTQVVRMPDGTEKRMSKSEYAEWLEKEKEAENTPPRAAVAPMRTGSVEKTFFANSRPASNPFDDMPPGEGPDSISVENAEGMSELAIMADKDKDKIQINKNKIYPGDQDPKSGTVVIEVQNKSTTKTIKNLELSFQIMNKERVVGHTTPVKLEYCPPSSTNATMRYSVEYQLNAVGRYLKPIVSKFEYAPDDTVAWPITNGLMYETTNDMVKVTGTVKNDTGSIMRDIKIYATFFNGQGELIGSSEPAKLLDDKASLVKDATGRFVIRFDTRGKTIEEVKSADIRVVGTKG